MVMSETKLEYFQDPDDAALTITNSTIGKVNIVLPAA